MAKVETGTVGAEYTLPPLPYAYDALKPHISEEILRIHHDKHHAGYVAGLNAALGKIAANRADKGMIQALCRDLAFHGSGHAMHSLYWNSMTPGGSGEATGALREAIERDFESYGAFQTQFINASVTGEGSAWGVLAWEPMGGRLLILQAENHQNLTFQGVTPLMVCDVWEHAYYLQYQNKRPDYVAAFMKLVNWPGVAQRLKKAMG